jgi:tRNA modification GTPase
MPSAPTDDRPHSRVEGAADPRDSASTICAIATPPGLSAIGVIRVSGPHAFQVVQPLFGGRGILSDFPSHTVHFGRVRHPDDGTTLDEAIFLVMKMPTSQTGEDVVEIQTHGNPHLLQNILSLLIAQGARLAQPGEFTRLAFLAGKIDLAQAEAVMELISAQNETHRRWALDQLKGRLSEKIGALRERLFVILSNVEAAIDFVEQEITLDSPEQIHDDVAAIQQEVRVLLDGYETGRQIREGATVVIAGRPNVGKSSLMNLLLGEARAIVTPYPGTTRDLLQEWVRWDDVMLKIVDTAGYRESQDPIEQEGVRRGGAAIRSADLVLLLFDATEPLQTEDRYLLDETLERKRLLILNKSDQPGKIETSTFPEAFLRLSAVTSEGVGLLRVAIRSALQTAPEKERPLVALLRHRDALERADTTLTRAVETARGGMAAWEFLAADLREASEALGEIVGASVSDDLLDRIFNQFCIGK